MSLMNSGKLRRFWLVLFVVLLASIIGFKLSAPNARELARDADRRAGEMYDAYCEAPFNAALQTVLNYIEYLEAHKDKIGRYRDIDSMLFGAHLRAGYMLLFTADNPRAYSHLNAAYEYHRQHRSPRNQELVAREEFVDFAISANAQVDDKFKILWKNQARIDTNVVEAVKSKFR